MNISFIQRALSVLFASLLTSAAMVGCQAEAADESAPEEEVAETEQALLNCKGQCAKFFMLCIQWGEDPELCGADRDACMAECDERTCEPGEPDCCQGQPTCW